MTKEDLQASEQEMFEHFDPNKPPILSNYDKLKERFKLPSRVLLRLEKMEYNKYIKVLRKVCKALVKKTRISIIENAQRVIHKHFKQANLNFKIEVDSVYQQFSQIKEDYLNKVKELEEMKEKYIKQEMAMIQSIIYFQKLQDNYEPSDFKDDDQCLSSALHSKSRRLTIIGDFMKSINSTSNMELSDPFNFYSFGVKLETQDQLKLCKDIYIKSLGQKITDLQKSVNRANDEIENYSKLVNTLHREEVKKDETIKQLKNQIVGLKLDIESKEKDTILQVDIVSKGFTEQIEMLSSQYEEYRILVEEEIKVHEGIRRQNSSKIKELELLVNKLKKVTQYKNI